MVNINRTTCTQRHTCTHTYINESIDYSNWRLSTSWFWYYTVVMCGIIIGGNWEKRMQDGSGVFFTFLWTYNGRVLQVAWNDPVFPSLPACSSQNNHRMCEERSILRQEGTAWNSQGLVPVSLRKCNIMNQRGAAWDSLGFTSLSPESKMCFRALSSESHCPSGI